MRNIKSATSFLIINTLLLICSYSFAQTITIDSLQKELKSIEDIEGEFGLNYAQKLIEIGTFYYEKNNDNEALIYLNKSERLLKIKSENLPRSDKKRIGQEIIIRKGHLAIDIIKWHFFIKTKEYEKSAKLFEEKKWTDLVIDNKQFNRILEIFEILAVDKGTESTVFFNQWNFIYAKFVNLNELELLWQLLIKKRISEFGENSDGHISALFGLSKCYQRFGENTKYLKLKAEVEAKWANEYDYSMKVKSEAEIQDTSYIVSVVMPRFPSCEIEAGSDEEKKKCADNQLLNFMYKNIKYPDIALKKNAKGYVVVAFTVTEHGTITNLEIIQDPGHGCAAEVMRILNMMNELPSRWKPGVKDGKNVRVRYNMPVKFSIG